MNSSPRSGLSFFLFPVHIPLLSLGTRNLRHLCREHHRARLSPSHSRRRNATMLCPRRTHTRISKPLSVHFFPYLPFHAALRTVTLRTYACPFPSSPPLPPLPPPPPVPLCIFPLVPSRSFARAYQQSILRTWECEMACPAMPAMLLESRCGRVDCLGLASLSLFFSFSVHPLFHFHMHKRARVHAHIYRYITTHLTTPPPVSRVHAVTSDSCTTDAARRILPCERDVPRTFS